MNKQVFSEAWTLIKQDLYKIWKGFLIATGGAVLAFLPQVSGIIDYTQYDQFGPFLALGVGALCSSLINVIQKWMSNTTYIK